MSVNQRVHYRSYKISRILLIIATFFLRFALTHDRRNPTYPNVLDFNDATTLQKSNFNVKHPTVIYIHGYSDSSSGKGPIAVRNGTYFYKYPKAISLHIIYTTKLSIVKKAFT